MFGPKVLTAVAILMMATARVGLKSGTLNLYFSTQKPDFFAQYAAHAFETAANRRGLGTAIMRYATKMLQQRASAIPDDDTENEDTATGPASQLEKPPPPSSVDNGQGGMGPTPAKDSRGGGEGTSGEGAEGEGGAAASGLGQTPKPLVAAPTKPAPAAASAKEVKRAGYSDDTQGKRFRGRGAGTSGKGVEGGEGTAASKPASREGFSKHKVTYLLSNKKSLLNHVIDVSLITKTLESPQSL